MNIDNSECAFEQGYVVLKKTNFKLISPLIKEELENITITTSSITILVKISNIIILWV